MKPVQNREWLKNCGDILQLWQDNPVIFLPTSSKNQNFIAFLTLIKGEVCEI